MEPCEILFKFPIDLLQKVKYSYYLMKLSPNEDKELAGLPSQWRKNFHQIMPNLPEPPDWFKARMKAVRETPLLSLEQIRRQFRGGIEQRNKL
jgi:hypothetical protein